jgi:uncharacterized membrane protein YgdD (TMEM256/DUF423 family)
MSYRIWLFLAGLSGCAAVLAGAYGAHTLNSLSTFSAMTRIYETGALYHALHSVALTLTAVLIAATEGRRGAFATWLLNIAALGFLLGIVMFSGGIYHQISQGLQTGSKIVPAGGIAFLVGWIALALSAFGFRGTQVQASGV